MPGFGPGIEGLGPGIPELGPGITGFGAGMERLGPDMELLTGALLAVSGVTSPLAGLGLNGGLLLSGFESEQKQTTFKKCTTSKHTAGADQTYSMHAVVAI